MSNDNQKLKNNLMLQKISKDIDTIKSDIFFIKNYIKVINDKQDIIHTEKKPKTEEKKNEPVGWYFF